MFHDHSRVLKKMLIARCFRTVLIKIGATFGEDEFEIQQKENQKERLAFIKRYSKWVKSVPNEIWSKQQAVLINSFLEFKGFSTGS